ncbi:RHS repeat-associated core domain-containing protein [Opitutaceae bacterium TAV4]|nr:RHS repeat-associated core domain-containing protein [Opitutaceae bacterium TAV4]
MANYYDYGVNTDGTTWSKITQVSPTGERWTKTTVNHLGQTISEEKPALGNNILFISYIYDTCGHLIRKRQGHNTGDAPMRLIADTLIEYDALGNISRTGLDVNANDTLDLASSDQILDTITTFSQYELAWWLVRQTKVYPTVNNNSAIQVMGFRQRLSGLTATLASETVTIDIDGNVTHTTIHTDPAHKFETKATSYPDSALNTVSITYNGRLISKTSKTVESPTIYGYDALGRQVSIKDPRHAQPSRLSFNSSTGQLASETDAAGNTTYYTYFTNGHTGAGQRSIITNPLGQTQRFAYDLQNRITHIWGSISYPQSYIYTAYGEQASLTTWRNAGNVDFDSPSWPSPTNGDTTTWTYDAATGLLTHKKYADTNGVHYIYDALGRRITRIWARNILATSLITSYGYSPVTGNLLSIEYNDDTPNIAFAYDRLGRQATVVDAGGTRTFTYDPVSLRLKTEELGSYFENRIITRNYQNSSPGEIPGRLSGIQLGTNSDLAEDYTLSYGYDNLGRLSNLITLSGIFTYGYMANSDLLGSLSSPAHETTYEYEPNRDLRTEVRNRMGSGGGEHSSYIYTYDSIGRRNSRIKAGMAFGIANYDRFSYNSHSEAVEIRRYDGSNPDNYESDPETISARRLYHYDLFGNRLTSQEGAEATRVYTTNALNQYIGTTNPPFTSTYDEDGNQTYSENGWYFQWDAENRLRHARDFNITPNQGSQLVEFIYDYKNRRIGKNIQIYDGTIWQSDKGEIYVHDDNRVIAQYRSNNGTLQKQQTYAWGLDLSATLDGAGNIGGLLSVTINDSSYYATHDANGNISEYLNSNSEIEAHFQYDPFGQIVTQSGSNLDRFSYRFSSKYLDAETGIYYFTFRYYNPTNGRWLSRDPIEEVGGIALYGFCENDPINRYDPYGLVPPGRHKVVNHTRTTYYYKKVLSQKYSCECTEPKNPECEKETCGYKKKGGPKVLYSKFITRIVGERLNQLYVETGWSFFAYEAWVALGLVAEEYNKVPPPEAIWRSEPSLETITVTSDEARDPLAGLPGPSTWVPCSKKERGRTAEEYFTEDAGPPEVMNWVKM